MKAEKLDQYFWNIYIISEPWCEFGDRLSFSTLQRALERSDRSTQLMPHLYKARHVCHAADARLSHFQRIVGITACWDEV